MFKKFYTTQMSANSKILWARFAKMRSEKTSKMLGVVLSVVLALMFLFVTVVVANVFDGADNDYRVEITNNDELIEFAYKPFYEDGTVYVPLRELLEKLGIMENERSEIVWDNGTVYLAVETNLSYNTENKEEQRLDVAMFYARSFYKIEIGKPEIIVNARPTETGYDMSISKMMEKAPVLKDNTTYIPFEYLYQILTVKQYVMSSVVYDGNGNVVYVLSSPKYVNANLMYPCPGNYRISSGFDAGRNHMGIDIAAPYGTEVVATLEGDVIAAGFNSEKGNYVIIKGADNIEVLYAHLSQSDVNEGGYVTKGQTVGRVGATGMATGAHLHFEVKIDGENINPLFCFNDKNENDS